MAGQNRQVLEHFYCWRWRDSLIPMTGYKLAPSYNANLENMNYHIGMGHTAEAVAEKYKITEKLQINFHASHMLKC